MVDWLELHNYIDDITIMIVFSSHKKHLVTTRLHLKMEMKILQTIIVGILSFKTVVAGPQYGGGQQSQGTKIWIGFITILIAIKIRCNILLWFIVSLWGSFFEHFILQGVSVKVSFSPSMSQGLNLIKSWWSMTLSLPRHGRFCYLTETFQ